MKRKLNFIIVLLLIISINTYSQKPSILINGTHTLASSDAKFPYWLSSGNSLNIGNKVVGISVIQYRISPIPGGGNDLLFDTVMYISSLQNVPVGKVWKIESAICDTTVTTTISGGGGDNWGSQAVVTGTTLTGDGTSSTPLDLDQQSAENGQVLKWDGSAWSPYNVPDYALTTGSANTYAITLDPVPASYTTGMVVHFKANFSNTGAATLNVNGLGAVTIKRNYDQNLSADDIKSGQMVIVMYDGTNFQMLTQLGSPPPYSDPASYGFSLAGGLYYKIVYTHGYITSYSGVGVNNYGWRLATQTEVQTLVTAGVISNGWNGWSGDGYPGQEAGYQYYWQNNSGTVNWHQSDWGTNNYQRAVLIWIL